MAVGDMIKGGIILSTVVYLELLQFSYRMLLIAVLHITLCNALLHLHYTAMFPMKPYIKKSISL